MTSDEVKEIFHKKRLILDGATGTELSARGIETSLPLWSAEALLISPLIVKQIHKDYIDAGADIISTNTFRTTKRTFKKIGKDQEARKMTLLACKLAKEAVRESGKQVLIGGSMAPLEDCYSPSLVPEEKELQKEHLEYAKDLKEGGVDFLFIETMISLREIKAAVEAAQKLKMSFGISFCVDKRGNLLSGEKLKNAVELVSSYNPLFVGLNCVSVETLDKNINKLVRLTSLPVAAYAQGDGVPDADQGWSFLGEDGAETYLEYAKKWVKKGVRIIGGCCGTNPEYIQKLSRELKD